MDLYFELQKRIKDAYNAGFAGSKLSDRYYGDKIPVKKQNGALSAYAPGALDGNARAVFLGDETIFGSGKEGYFITTEAIYSHRFKGSKPDERKKIEYRTGYYRIPIAQISDVKRNHNDYVTIYFKNNSSVSVYCSIFKGYFFSIARACMDAYNACEAANAAASSTVDPSYMSNTQQKELVSWMRNMLASKEEQEATPPPENPEKTCGC